MLFGLLLTGCRGSEPFDKITRAATPEAFNYVSPLMGRSTSTVYNDAGYYIVFDDDNKVASLTISNLRVPGYDTPRTLTFVNVPMDYTSNNHRIERMISAESLTSHDPVNEGTVIKDVTIIYIQSNSLDPNPADGIYARFIVDDAYLVTAYPYEIFADGTTRVDNLTMSETSYDYTTIYHMTLDPTSMTADMSVKNLSLNNSRVDFELHNLQLSLIDDGYTVAFGPSTTVDSDSGLVIEDFEAQADLLKELNVKFVVKLPNNDSYWISAFLNPGLSD